MSISEQRSELMRSVATETGRKKKPVSFCLLLQPFQYGQRLALEPGTEPLGQLLEGADPFARVDGIADAVDAAI